MRTCVSSHHHDKASQKSGGVARGPSSCKSRALRTNAAPTRSFLIGPGLEGQFWKGVIRTIGCAGIEDRIDAVLRPGGARGNFTISEVGRIGPLAYFAG
jgi:hypothetical protein